MFHSRVTARVKFEPTIKKGGGMESKENDNIVIGCLQHAIEDAQGTIRAYDGKAEILGILLTVALGVTNFTYLQQQPGMCSKYLLAASWIFGLAAIGVLGMVLHPKKNQFKGLSLGTYTPTGAYFLFNVLSSPEKSVIALAKNARETDWVSELTYENMKLSLIRECKHEWFVLALKLAGVTLLLITLTVIGSVGWQAT
ncbi:MAG: hypothetical protein Q7T65_07210 [Thiobacillus sp.]|nr:hypothetical protein [Thiobacillus sp.]